MLWHSYTSTRPVPDTATVCPEEYELDWECTDGQFGKNCVSRGVGTFVGGGVGGGVANTLVVIVAVEVEVEVEVEAEVVANVVVLV